MHSLDRFHHAQAGDSAGYATALAELRHGGKRSHWIWYVFPQLEGLGRSSAARLYALHDIKEACDYLRDPILRARYEEITRVVNEQLARGVLIEDLMGSRIDAFKFVSSVTLFRAAAQSLVRKDPAFASLASRCDSILRQTSNQGYPVCVRTLARIEKRPSHCKTNRHGT